jgi:integrase
MTENDLKSHRVTENELKFALESGIIDAVAIQAQYAMKKREDLLNKHKTSVWQGKNGYWYTYLQENDGRRLIKKKTKEEVEDAIAEHYDEVFNVRKLFHSWNDYRLDMGKISQATHSKNRYLYNRHLKPYSATRVENITPEDITLFIEDEVCRKHLKYKAYLNLKGLIKGMCQYARRKKIAKIDYESAFADLDLNDKDFDKTRHKDREMEVFNEEELPIVLDYLENNLEDIRNVAMLLILVSGLRVGEICVLHLDDWLNDNAFMVKHTETKYKDKNGKVCYKEKPTPKTLAGIRTVVIPTKYSYIHRLLKERYEGGIYCFADENGDFIKDYVIRNRFYRVCDLLQLPRRSPHDARRTYATSLLNNGANEMFIIDQMGHTDINTTKQYYYRNVRNVESKSKMIDELIG